MTVRHVVTWKLLATEPEEKAAAAARIAELLVALPATVSEIRDIRVGANSVDAEGNWDVVLIADYDDAEALGRYQVHPDHQAAAGVIRTLVSERATVDFEL
ncbi:Dabb family protein [Compostimonas suwonensis]|uniref:Stress responsive alpha/beta barrel protein n=1 Tax=Compostimonas suwonensis TaxID=1048394 RepID=A0A2M9C3C2_9MICO|nr:Dabb family protein [Compostimonas suwonensis]PJJ65034.1 stress responsive alpha/beta barrel protein [Compostimonas suwonensis]